MSLKSSTQNTQPTLHCDGQVLKRLAQAGLAWLEKNHEQVNALNVFPVPDGDTGTNMLLTMRSACKEVANIEETHLGKVAQLIYNGALMGARGNSGVILSQLWRGFARGIEKEATLNAEGLVRGFQEAVRTAYQAVQTPVEGTMLTVAREAYEEAALAAQSSQDLAYILARVVERSHQSVQRTPELLDVLREAGVVDSGGMGLAYLLEGMLRHVNGEDLEVTGRTGQAAVLESALEPGELGYGYDVQFLIKGENLDVNQIRADIEAMGESTLVVGDSRLVKVHVHVHNPAIPLGYGAERGALMDIVVENMQEQYQDFIKERAGAPSAGTASIEPPAIQEGQIAAITVAPGEGLMRIFYSLGTGWVIPGGQTMNPSTEQIVEAINRVPTDKIVILPNNKNILMTAQQAVQLTNGKHVEVIPTTTIPQGISAMLALDPEGDLEQVVEAMRQASQMVETGEVTTSTRDVTINGVKVKQGQIIGLHNDVLSVSGDTVNSVVIALLDKMGAAERELITLYYGAEINPRDAKALVEHLQQLYPEQEIEMREGGQPHYFYILSAE